MSKIDSIKNGEQIVKEYKEKADAIIHEMLIVLTRAQRIIDDKAYRKILEKLH